LEKVGFSLDLFFGKSLDLLVDSVYYKKKYKDLRESNKRL